MKQRIMGAPTAGPACLEMDRAFWRELYQLCHPDKHGSSPLSVKVSQRLNEIGKELDKTPDGKVQWVIFR